MTALDNALNNSSVVFRPHKLYAFWRESDNGDATTNMDSLSNLSGQLSGATSISHTIDDGLPDTVTMTTGGDASGALEATLNGREGMALASAGVRAYNAANAISGTYTPSAATLLGAIPNGVQRGDFMVVAILVNTTTFAPQQTGDLDPKYAWKFLGSATLGSSMAVYLYGRIYYPGQPALQLQSNGTFNYITLSTAFWAINPNGSPLGWRVTEVDTKAETVSGTAHTIPNQLQDKGFQLAFWGSAPGVGPWSYPAGGTKVAEIITGTLDLMETVTPLRDSGIQTLTGNTTTATAAALMAALAVEPYQRPRMDGRQFFSPFNANSPIYGFDRDTALTRFDFNVQTDVGEVPTTLHSGIMGDLPISGRQAKVLAVSKTRIDLNASVTLPVVFAYREGCTTDWLCTWLLARGGKYIGPAPTPYTRAWAPLHGSTHAHIDGPYTYNYTVKYDSTGGWYGWKNPQSVQGPFLTGMYAEQTSTRAIEVKLNFTRHDLNVNPLSILQADPYAALTAPVYRDSFSQAKSQGRITFWLRGDAAASAPAYYGATPDNDFLFNFYHYITDGTGAYLGYVRCSVRSSDRYMEVQMGSAAAGFSNYFYSSGTALNTTGAWDFYGFSWDFAAGKVDLVHNGTEVHSTSFATDGRNVITQLPPTDLQGRTLGYATSTIVRAHVPISEFMWDVGVPYTVGQWASFYPTPAAPGSSVIARPTYQWLQAIAEPTPVVVWDTLASLAQSTLAWFRANEDDNFEYLPMSYFGETAQLTSSAVEDTQVNAQDLDVTLDPSKSRNVVTVQFPETSVTTNPVTILSVSQSVAIPKGLTSMTFTLDSLAVEIHGQIAPFGAVWTLTNLTAVQINVPSGIPLLTHYLTANTLPDGTGVVVPGTKLIASIQYADAATITIQFNNRYGQVVYLANNGTEVPFLNILGYAVSSNDGYVTQRDSGSIGIRKERGLTASLDWVHTRNTANDLAMWMAALLARPRPQIEVTVFGDPRRRPGQLVTIKDSAGTAAAGTWRILSVNHTIDGAQYTQDLSLVYVGPVMTWDSTTATWDNSVWGP